MPAGTVMVTTSMPDPGVQSDVDVVGGIVDDATALDRRRHEAVCGRLERARVPERDLVTGRPDVPSPDTSSGAASATGRTAMGLRTEWPPPLHVSEPNAH